MKRVALIALVFILCPIAVLSKDSDPRELLSKVNVSHPYYGNKVYGDDKVNVFQSRDNSILLVYQARYGGDGDHSENLLKIFRFQSGVGKKLLDQNIDSLEFVQENKTLKFIKGKYVTTLCDVCDGWDASEPEDIFFVPVIIDVELLTVKSTLNDKEKKALIARLDRQSDKNIAEKLSCGDKKYTSYVSKVKKEVKELLDRK